MEDIIRLLYAEDDPDWAVSIRMLLEENGFRGWIPDPGDISTDKTGYGFAGYRYAGKKWMGLDL